MQNTEIHDEKTKWIDIAVSIWYTKPVERLAGAAFFFPFIVQLTDHDYVCKMKTER